MRLNGEIVVADRDVTCGLASLYLADSQKPCGTEISAGQGHLRFWMSQGCDGPVGERPSGVSAVYVMVSVCRLCMYRMAHSLAKLATPAKSVQP